MKAQIYRWSLVLSCITLAISLLFVVCAWPTHHSDPWRCFGIKLPIASRGLHVVLFNDEPFNDGVLRVDSIHTLVQNYFFGLRPFFLVQVFQYAGDPVNWTAVFPVWALLVPSSLLPMFEVWRRRIIARRWRCRCRQCDYDLRGNRGAETCPECGAAIVWPQRGRAHPKPEAPLTIEPLNPMDEAARQPNAGDLADKKTENQPHAIS